MKKKASSFKIAIIFSVLSLLGVFIIPKLSIRLNPSESLPSITVKYSLPNASPYNIEREVTTKLESSFAILAGVSKMSSKSSKGNAYITLILDKHTDINLARFEVATIIRQLFKSLPETLSYPTLSVNKPEESENERAFLSYSISSPDKPFIIQKTVINSFEPQINSIVGVDKTQVHGANLKEYLIQYNHSLLQQLAISKQEILTALQQQFTKESLGEAIYNKEYITLSINSSGKLNWHIPIKKVGKRIVHLDDIAIINELEQEANNYYRVNGKNAITLSIYAAKNTNTILLAKDVAEKIQEIQETLPKEYTIIETYNASEYLQTELNKIYERTGYTVIILLLFILLVSKSFRYLTVIMLSLIANLGMAFLFYYAFKVEIQLYSLAGITISLGLIIDNSIVMIDHIKKQGNTKVFIPILASTLTTVGALSVIYFLDNKYKVNLIDFALVIIINLGVSLVISLFLIPALLDKIPLKKTKRKKWELSLQQWFYRMYKNFLLVLFRFKKTALFLIILAFGVPLFILPQKLEKNGTFLEKTYNITLGNEWYRENLRPYLDKYLGGSFRLFSQHVFDEAVYGRNEETKLYITASMEKNSTLNQMNEAFLEIENFLQQFSKIKQFTSNIFSGEHARLEITFRDPYSSFPFELRSQLVRKSLNLDGIAWNISGVGEGFSNGKGSNNPVNFSIEAKGYNYDNLNTWIDTLKVALEKHPRVNEVLIRENSYWLGKTSYEYRFLLEKEKLSLLNSTPSKVFNELKNLTLSKQSNLSINIQGKYMPIRIESNNSKRYDLWNIQHTPIDSLSTPIFLNDIAHISQNREEENIFKENQEYTRMMQFQYTGPPKLGAKFLNEKLKELKAKLPLGYKFEEKGRDSFLIKDKNNNYFLLLALVIVIIYFVCSILFESLKQPFIILSLVPISFIGVFLTFYIFDFNFDQGGLASFVLLSGITVNASIFIINRYNILKKEQPSEDSLDLYTKAFKQKILPIVLTIVSTILGFIPFVKDGQNQVFWFALGVGTIGGLLFSLIGILFYLPLFTLKRN